MLNYIWLSLIVIGIGVAIYGDLHDLSGNKYHNNEEIPITIHVSGIPAESLASGQRYSATIEISPREYEEIARGGMRTPIIQKVEFIPNVNGTGLLTITLDERSPSLWREILKAQKKDNLVANVRWSIAAGAIVKASMRFEPVKFTNLNAVTNDGIIKYAKTAVELAIGLIGIMALWLGIMKIAEQSGLVALLARALRPVTTRLFPDVPADHPAMGAMIMNISANMLGVTNAATPLGLKAMEELNKLNPKAGTATDAMCTFLVINTSNVQIIPATVIAIRAAAGSGNPTEILGPVIIATFITLVIGITTVKLFAKLRIFRSKGDGSF